MPLEIQIIAHAEDGRLTQQRLVAVLQGGREAYLEDKKHWLKMKNPHDSFIRITYNRHELEIDLPHEFADGSERPWQSKPTSGPDRIHLRFL
jgi:hypothetical protein